MCVTARVYCAVSDSVAIRVVPIDSDGNERPEATQGVVGGPDDYQVAAFLDVIGPFVETLVNSKV